MKRMNVMVDEDLLESARRALGEKTYSGTIAKLLEQVAQRQRLDQAIRQIQANGDPFDPDYVAEMWPHLARPKRISADEQRAPRKKKSRRASR